MRTLGGLLFVVGAGLAVLDLVGIRFLPYQLAGGLILAIVGLVLIVLGRRERHLDAETVTEVGATDAVASRATTVEREVVPPPDHGMSSPVGYGPPAESGAAPGTAITSAPGEATAEAERTHGTTARSDRPPEPTDRDRRG